MGSNPTLSAIFSFYVQSVRAGGPSVYLRRTLRLQEREVVLRPGPFDVGFGLLLALAHPGSVVLLRHLYAGVAQQNRDALERDLR